MNSIQAARPMTASVPKRQAQLAFGMKSPDAAASTSGTAVNPPFAPRAEIQQAVQNPRAVPYVYDSGNRPIPNANGRQAEIDQRPEESKTTITERENFMGSISGLPVGGKEVVGFLGGIWFETLGKLGLVGEQLIDAQQAAVKQIIASCTTNTGCNPTHTKTSCPKRLTGCLLDTVLNPSENCFKSSPHIQTAGGDWIDQNIRGEGNPLFETMVVDLQNLQPLGLVYLSS